MRLSIACKTLSRLRGLAGNVSDDAVLMLAPCNDVHTFTMRRAIDVAFASWDGVVLESHREVLPRRRLRNRRAAITLERYSRDGPWYEPGDWINLAPPTSSSVDQKGHPFGSEDMPLATGHVAV